MYSLVEYKEEGKTIRKDRSFEKDYIGSLRCYSFYW